MNEEKKQTIVVTLPPTEFTAFSHRIPSSSSLFLFILLGIEAHSFLEVFHMFAKGFRKK